MAANHTTFFHGWKNTLLLFQFISIAYPKEAYHLYYAWKKYWKRKCHIVCLSTSCHAICVFIKTRIFIVSLPLTIHNIYSSLWIHRFISTIWMVHFMTAYVCQVESISTQLKCEQTIRENCYTLPWRASSVSTSFIDIYFFKRKIFKKICALVNTFIYDCSTFIRVTVLEIELMDWLHIRKTTRIAELFFVLPVHFYITSIIFCPPA